jgi:hypothetical protein
MPFILPSYQGILDPALNPTGDLPDYEVTMRRLSSDLPSPNSYNTAVYTFEGIASTLYLFVQDDMFYYRTGATQARESTLDWRHPRQGAPPWCPLGCAHALQKRFSLLRVWSKTQANNKFKADLTALDWPAAVSPAQLQSVFAAPTVQPPTSLTTLEQALLAACGELCRQAMQVCVSCNICASR